MLMKPVLVHPSQPGRLLQHPPQLGRRPMTVTLATIIITVNKKFIN